MIQKIRIFVSRDINAAGRPFYRSVVAIDGSGWALFVSDPCFTQNRARSEAEEVVRELQKGSSTYILVA